MLESSQMLKDLLEKRGIDWNKSFPQALNQLLEMMDAELGGIIFQKFTEKLNEMDEKLCHVFNKSSQARQDTYTLLDRNQDTLDRISKAVGEIKDNGGNPLLSNENGEIASLYTAIIKSAKEVFGEERMTDSAIASICESASYITWRNITGMKNDQIAPPYRGKRI